MTLRLLWYSALLSCVVAHASSLSGGKWRVSERTKVLVLAALYLRVGCPHFCSATRITASGACHKRRLTRYGPGCCRLCVMPICLGSWYALYPAVMGRQLISPCLGHSGFKPRETHLLPCQVRYLTGRQKDRLLLLLQADGRPLRQCAAWCAPVPRWRGASARNHCLIAHPAHP